VEKPLILIADDAEDNRAAYSIMFAHHGYRVLHAGDGERALELARLHAPDLVLLDLRMPVLDGWDTVRRLKADPATRPIPVLALTAEDQPRERFRDAGFCGSARKPVTPRHLMHLVELCLEPGDDAPTWRDLPADAALAPRP
jgi:CheY-like chemotaxis protein